MAASSTTWRQYPDQSAQFRGVAPEWVHDQEAVREVLLNDYLADLVMVAYARARRKSRARARKGSKFDRYNLMWALPINKRLVSTLLHNTMMCLPPGARNAIGVIPGSRGSYYLSRFIQRYKLHPKSTAVDDGWMSGVRDGMANRVADDIARNHQAAHTEAMWDAVWAECAVAHKWAWDTMKTIPTTAKSCLSDILKDIRNVRQEASQRANDARRERERQEREAAGSNARTYADGGFRWPWSSTRRTASTADPNDTWGNKAREANDEASEKECKTWVNDYWRRGKDGKQHRVSGYRIHRDQGGRSADSK